MAYLDSEKVKVYPSSFRGTGTDNKLYNPESRLNTENNITRSIRAMSIKDTTDKSSYVISYTSGILKCVIYGYYFELDLTGESFTDDDVYATIYVSPINTNVDIYKYSGYVLARYDTTSPGDTLDDTSKFYGLCIDSNANTNTNYHSLHILEKVGDSYTVPIASYLRASSETISDGSSDVPISKKLTTESLYTSSASITDANITGIATISSAKITGTATMNYAKITSTATISTANITNAKITGIATIWAANITGIATIADATITNAKISTATIWTANITGTAIITSAIITGTATITTADIANANLSYISAKSATPSAATIYSKSSLSPWTTNQVNLGSSGLRWEHLYASTLDGFYLNLNGDTTNGNVYSNLIPITSDDIPNLYLGTPTYPWSCAYLKDLNITGNATISTANITTANIITANITTANITTAWISSANIVSGTISQPSFNYIRSNLVPIYNNSQTLGNTSYRWKSAYLVDASITGNATISTADITNANISTATISHASFNYIDSNLVPNNDNSQVLGGTSFRWKSAYLVNASITGTATITNANITGTATISKLYSGSSSTIGGSNTPVYLNNGTLTEITSGSGYGYVRLGAILVCWGRIETSASWQTIIFPQEYISDNDFGISIVTDGEYNSSFAQVKSVTRLGFDIRGQENYTSDEVYLRWITVGIGK